MSDESAPHAPRSVVILVHGIRTNAPWIAMLRSQFESAGIIVEPTNYGRLDVFRFLWGSRRTPVDAVWDSVRDIQRLYPGANVSFLAHSFGTYIVARLLQREFTFKAHRIAFCGSVVPYNFPFMQIAERFSPPIVNETSAHDPWPVLAESLSWGYGSAGTYGFKIPRVRDRWHRGLGHSQYLTADFCKKYWIPFFRDGEIIEGDLVDEPTRYWLQLLSVISIKSFSIILMSIALAWYFLFPSVIKYPSIPNQGKIGTQDIPITPNSPSDLPSLGLKPRPDCYVEQKVDATVAPPRLFQVWRCP